MKRRFELERQGNVLRVAFERTPTVYAWELDLLIEVYRFVEDQGLYITLRKALEIVEALSATGQYDGPLGA